MPRDYTITPEESERRRLRIEKLNATITEKKKRERAKKGAETWQLRNEKRLREMQTIISVE